MTISVIPMKSRRVGLNIRNVTAQPVAFKNNNSNTTEIVDSNLNLFIIFITSNLPDIIQNPPSKEKYPAGTEVQMVRRLSLPGIHIGVSALGRRIVEKKQGESWSGKNIPTADGIVSQGTCSAAIIVCSAGAARPGCGFPKAPEKLV